MRTWMIVLIPRLKEGELCDLRKRLNLCHPQYKFSLNVGYHYDDGRDSGAEHNGTFH